MGAGVNNKWKPLGIGEIDLTVTLDGFQAFRWDRVGDDCRYEGVIGETIVGLRQVDGDVLVSDLGFDPGKPIADIANDYLASGPDPVEMFKRFGDEPWARDIPSKRGLLQVLRQDPWECLAAFICSPQSKIPRIKQMVRSIAKFGQNLVPDGRYKAFPSPEVIADLDEKYLESLKLGYRAPRLVESAQQVANSGQWLQELRSASYADARLELELKLPGVGPKVADCVLAYSLDKPEAFPIDVHVKKAMKRLYKLSDQMKDEEVAAWSRDRFGKWSSLVQLYVFWDEYKKSEAQALEESQ